MLRKLQQLAARRKFNPKQRENTYENEPECPGSGLNAGAARPGHGPVHYRKLRWERLATSLLGGGGGISISNVTLIGTTNQQGTFSDGIAAGIGIDSGVMLTSGNVNNALPPNNCDSQGTSTGTGSDAQLTALSGFSTFDKNILEFDFTTTTGDLFFSYVFASEEFNEYTNSTVNDVFGFFVDGVNIALVPGTSTPVYQYSELCYSSGGALPAPIPRTATSSTTTTCRTVGLFSPSNTMASLTCS